MKRKLSLITTITMVALGATALAATNQYTGEVIDDPTAAVTLKVKKRGAERTVTGFVANDFQITCKEPDDARLGNASLTGEASVGEQGRFKLEGENETQSFAMKGRLIGKRSAKGKFSFSGEVALEGADVRCESGELAWRAER